MFKVYHSMTSVFDGWNWPRRLEPWVSEHPSRLPRPTSSVVRIIPFERISRASFAGFFQVLMRVLDNDCAMETYRHIKFKRLHCCGGRRWQRCRHGRLMVSLISHNTLVTAPTVENVGVEADARNRKGSRLYMASNSFRWTLGYTACFRWFNTSTLSKPSFLSRALSLPSVNLIDKTKFGLERIFEDAMYFLINGECPSEYLKRVLSPEAEEECFNRCIEVVSSSSLLLLHSSSSSDNSSPEHFSSPLESDQTSAKSGTECPSLGCNRRLGL